MTRTTINGIYKNLQITNAQALQNRNEIREAFIISDALTPSDIGTADGTYAMAYDANNGGTRVRRTVATFEALKRTDGYAGSTWINTSESAILNGNGETFAGYVPTYISIGENLQYNLQSIDKNMQTISSNVVHRTGDESIAGIKSFTDTIYLKTSMYLQSNPALPFATEQFTVFVGGGYASVYLRTNPTDLQADVINLFVGESFTSTSWSHTSASNQVQVYVAPNYAQLQCSLSNRTAGIQCIDNSGVKQSEVVLSAGTYGLAIQARDDGTKLLNSDATGSDTLLLPAPSNATLTFAMQDWVDGNSVKKAGDTMTGLLTINKTDTGALLEVKNNGVSKLLVSDVSITAKVAVVETPVSIPSLVPGTFDVTGLGFIVLTEENGSTLTLIGGVTGQIITITGTATGGGALLTNISFNRPGWGATTFTVNGCSCVMLRCISAGSFHFA